MIKLIAIINHPVFMDSIRSVFRNKDEDKIEFVGLVNSTKEALPLLKDSLADIVLLDLAVTEYSGVDFCHMIKRQFPNKKVIAITSGFDTSALYDTWMNKADAILLNYCGRQELVETIYSVMSGLRVLGKNVPNFDAYFRTLAKPKPKLTTSEQRILSLLAKGHTREETGKILSSNQNAISFHCKNIFKKFNRNKLADVLEVAKRRELIN